LAFSIAGPSVRCNSPLRYHNLDPLVTEMDVIRKIEGW
jgi:hypothetical protein